LFDQLENAIEMALGGQGLVIADLDAREMGDALDLF
jgi:hypothetical protein